MNVLSLDRILSTKFVANSDFPRSTWKSMRPEMFEVSNRNEFYVRVDHTSVAVSVLDDANGIDAVVVDVVLELTEQRLRVVGPLLRRHLLIVARRRRSPLPGPVSPALPLPPGPLRYGDLEEHVVRRGVVRHNRRAEGVLGIHVQGE